MSVGFFFWLTTTSNNIQNEVMSGNLSFFFDHPIIRKMIKYFDQQLSVCGWYLISQDLVVSSLIGQSKI
jgi:hypothetical protein